MSKQITIIMMRWFERIILLSMAVALVPIFLFESKINVDRMTMIELYKVMVAVIAVLLPTYFAAVTLFNATSEAKLKELRDIFCKLAKTEDFLIINQLMPYFRSSYRFTISIMAVSLFWSSVECILIMLSDFWIFPAGIFIGIYLFLSSITAGVINILQFVGLMQLIDEKGEKIILLNDSYEKCIYRQKK